ncbi:hypothetical protein ACFFSY_25115 [Paenibacillus aurantiacus]|uniref:Uncharacterized protein n=1 Tax=Paenibacillus aurantiacus TaxID=1936118 RepID=A0ABV5KVH0_9BACL
MLEKLISLLALNVLEEIYLIGVVDKTEDGTIEFVTSMNFLYLEVGEQLIELAAIESYGRIRMSFADSFHTDFGLHDVEAGRVKIGQLVFENPLNDNKAANLTLYNPELDKGWILTDVLGMELANGQYLFIDPGYLGIKIGGLELKKAWEDNYAERVLPRIGAWPLEKDIRIAAKV